MGSRILSFSTDAEFAEDLNKMIHDSGYQNRSMFLRDASLFFADKNRRGELENMGSSTHVEGTLVIYFQHEIEASLLDLRHSKAIEVQSFQHNCLSESHTCVDVMLIRAQAGPLRKVISSLKDTRGVDKIVFTAAPFREAGCC